MGLRAIGPALSHSLPEVVMSGWFTTKRKVLIGGAALTVVGVGLYLFQPWTAFIDKRVEEGLPAAVVVTSAPQSASGAATAAPTSGPAATEAAELSRGSFLSGAHDTTGVARVIRQADGSAVLRLENLKTSNGPDVHVYLAADEAKKSVDGLGTGAVALGKLKGNLGDQNYLVPAGTDLGKLHSVVLWCDRFSVGFGAADLAAAK
jgi:hypothetical protein